MPTLTTDQRAATETVELVKVDCLPPGQAVAVCHGDLQLVLAQVRGQVYALRDICLRCGSSIAGGQLEGLRLTCPECGWQYELDGGSVVGLAPLSQVPVDVRVSDGRVWLAAAGTRPR